MSETNAPPNRFKNWFFLAFSWLVLCPSLLRASSKAEETAFLDIPVGGRPVAMGGAYSALANDAYAATLNPGGLGFLGSAQFAGEHLSYLESSQFDYVGAGVPLHGSDACGPSSTCPGASIGGAVQYFGGGKISGTDANVDPTGDFSTHFTVYNVSFGRAFTDRLSFGLTGKWINARLADVSASAYGADVGTMYQLNKNMTLAAVLTNVGSKLTFLNEGNPLPTAIHTGFAYQVENGWSFSTEGVYHQTGAVSGHLGFEYHPIPMASLRISYRTDETGKKGSLGGVAAGFGIQLRGIDFSYAWKPMSDLGVTQYISFGYSFGERSTTQGSR